MSSLRKLLGVSWKDKVPDTEVLFRTKSVSIDNIVSRKLLRWTGHVIRMDNSRLPKQFLYGELSQGQRAVGRQKKRYRDQVSCVLRSCHIPYNQLESLASDRGDWRGVCDRGLKRKEADCTRKREERRSKRKEKGSTPTTVGPPQYFCSDCGRGCLSPIGLISHQRSHQRKKRSNKIQQ